MKRLTTDDQNSFLFYLNIFFVKDREVWVRNGGPGPDYKDISLVQWIRGAAKNNNLDIEAADAESLGDEMYDALQYGDETVEGIVALLHAAAIQAAEVRDRLSSTEDILGDDYDLDRLRELVQADRDGRCVVLPCKIEDDVYINLLGKTLPFSVISISQMASTPTLKAMHGVRLCYIFKADDVGKTVFRTCEAAEQALREE